MSTTYAYLPETEDHQALPPTHVRVLDLYAFAKQQGYGPVVLIEDQAARSVHWSDRLLGKLLASRAQAGDVVLSTDLTCIGSSPIQVLSALQLAAERGVAVAVASIPLTFSPTLHGSVRAETLELATTITREFMSLRTRDGLQRARAEGRIGGRRQGSTGPLKLDPHQRAIAELVERKVSVAKLADQFGVTEKTMRKFIARHFQKTP